ncbi:MAG: rhomboid family intramembrane serine protease [Acidimicrobiia bacterium]
MDDRQDVIPVCYRHPDRQTYLACSSCGRPICGECAVDAAVGQRCPTCVAEAGTQRVVRARGGRLSLRDTSPATYFIIATTVVAYVLSFFGIVGFGAFAMSPLAVQSGEWWRLLTHALLHSGFIHIGFNMYALYILGPALERRLGTGRFVAAYVFAAVAGGVAVYYLAPPASLAVGASGAIFGLFGLWFGSALANRGTVTGNAQFRSILSLLLINAAISLLPGISWQGHLGGFLAGVVTFALVRAQPDARSSTWILGLLTVGLIVLTQVVPAVPLG